MPGDKTCRHFRRVSLSALGAAAFLGIDSSREQYRAGLSHNNDNMTKTLSETGKTGFYFRLDVYDLRATCVDQPQTSSFFGMPKLCCGSKGQPRRSSRIYEQLRGILLSPLVFTTS